MSSCHGQINYQIIAENKIAALSSGDYNRHTRYEAFTKYRSFKDCLLRTFAGIYSFIHSWCFDVKTGCLIIEVAEELVFEESSCRFKSSIIKYWYKNKNRKVVRRKFDIILITCQGGFCERYAFITREELLQEATRLRRAIKKAKDAWEFVSQRFKPRRIGVCNHEHSGWSQRISEVILFVIRKKEKMLTQEKYYRSCI